MPDRTPEPVVHARAAAEAVRQINHLTAYGDGGLTHPSQLADVLHELADTVSRLPQALGQLGRIAEQFGSRTDLHDDRGSRRDTETTCQVVGLLLAAEAVPTGTLAADLRSAAADLDHLAVDDA